MFQSLKAIIYFYTLYISVNLLSTINLICETSSYMRRVQSFYINAITLSQLVCTYWSTLSLVELIGQLHRTNSKRFGKFYKR